MLHGVFRARNGAIRFVPRGHRITAWCYNPSRFPSFSRYASSIRVLAIETSCDDTAVAILEKGREDGQLLPRGLTKPLATLLFNERITADSTRHKGVHPVESMESHRSNLAKLVDKSLAYLPNPSKKGVKSKHIITTKEGAVKMKPSFIAVTRGPGMRSNLACGLDTAKGLATAWQIPLVAVNHMLAHTLTPRLAMAIGESPNTNKGIVGELDEEFKKVVHGNDVKVTPQFPFLTLLVSGGHTMIIQSKSLTDHTILATTRDIAIGNALDHIGRLILPEDVLSKIQDTAYAKYLLSFAFSDINTFDDYPIPNTRGDEVEKQLNHLGWNLQTPLANTKELAFSFTGTVSRVVSLWAERSSQEGGISEAERLLFARTSICTAFEHLASRTTIVLEQLRKEGIELTTLVVSGGVAASPFLRHYLRKFLDVRGFTDVQLSVPSPRLCTDNAAMIAWAGLELFEAGFRSDLSINALRKWSMDSASDDGGIVGVGGWESTSKKEANRILQLADVASRSKKQTGNLAVTSNPNEKKLKRKEAVTSKLNEKKTAAEPAAP